MHAFPLTADFGAELGDVDLDDTDAILDAVHEWGVVVLRDVPMSDDEHVAFARRFGEPIVYPIQAAAGQDVPLEIIEDTPESPPKASRWHTDFSWVRQPPKLAFLCGIDIPERGGDTAWADTQAAYEALSPTMQGCLEGLRVFHDMEPGAEERFGALFSPEIVERAREMFGIGVEHPLVRTHPATGRRSLYVAGYWMDHVVGMHPEESDALLSFLMTHATQPRFTCRWRWHPGDMAIWDERRTMHMGIPDHYPRHRLVRRCTVTGEVPA